MCKPLLWQYYYAPWRRNSIDLFTLKHQMFVGFRRGARSIRGNHLWLPVTLYTWTTFWLSFLRDEPNTHFLSLTCRTSVLDLCWSFESRCRPSSYPTNEKHDKFIYKKPYLMSVWIQVFPFPLAPLLWPKILKQHSHQFHRQMGALVNFEIVFEECPLLCSDSLTMS